MSGPTEVSTSLARRSPTDAGFLPRWGQCGVPDVGVDPASIGVAWSAFDPPPMPIKEKGFDKLSEKL
jgi:hypothetical protein